MHERCRKATAHNVTQHVENHHIGVIKQVMFLQQLHGLTDNITAAACTRWRATGFNAHHAIVAFIDIVFRPLVLPSESPPIPARRSPWVRGAWSG